MHGKLLGAFSNIFLGVGIALVTNDINLINSVVIMLLVILTARLCDIDNKYMAYTYITLASYSMTNTLEHLATGSILTELLIALAVLTTLTTATIALNKISLDTKLKNARKVNPYVIVLFTILILVNTLAEPTAIVKVFIAYTCWGMVVAYLVTDMRVYLTQGKYKFTSFILRYCVSSLYIILLTVEVFISLNLLFNGRG